MAGSWGFGNVPGLGLGARTGGLFISPFSVSVFRGLGRFSDAELSGGTCFSLTPNGFATTLSDLLEFVTELCELLCLLGLFTLAYIPATSSSASVAEAATAGFLSLGDIFNLSV